MTGDNSNNISDLKITGVVITRDIKEVIAYFNKDYEYTSVLRGHPKLLQIEQKFTLKTPLIFVDFWRVMEINVFSKTNI